MVLRRRSAWLAALPVALAATVHASEEDPALLAAEQMPRADEAIVLDILPAGEGGIAVGERGHVLLSDDGMQWRQSSSVPTRSTLTAITRFGRHVWAVGHDAVIIGSTDDGQTWELQHADPAQAADADPNPFLDVLFVDAERGYAVGAYGWMAVTSDGGANWSMKFIGDLIAEEGLEDYEEDLDAEFEEDDFGEGDEGDEGYAGDEGDEGDGEFDYSQDFSDFDEDLYYDYHLNAIVRLDDGRLVIAAEAGYGYISEDEGESWRLVELPYEGSMFGMIATGPQSLLAFGLRGHVLASDDGGESWTEVDTGVLNSLLGGDVDASGKVVLVGANGQVLERDPQGGAFRSVRHPDGEDLGAVVITGDAVIVGGEIGVDRWSGEP